MQESQPSLSYVVEKTRRLDPGMSLDAFFRLLKFKVACRLKSEASNNYLSYAWWALEPMLSMSVFYVVFGLLLSQGTENFVAFLLCGLVPWLWFNKSISNAVGSIFGGRSIMLLSRVPIVLFPSEMIAQDLVKQTVVFALLLLFLSLYGIAPDIHWLALIPISLAQLALITACAMLAAAITPFIPDLRFFITTGLMMLMFGSGIFYGYEQITPALRPYYYLNPMASLIRAYRESLLYQQWPDFTVLGVIFACSTLVAALTIYLITRYSDAYRRLAAVN